VPAARLHLGDRRSRDSARRWGSLPLWERHRLLARTTASTRSLARNVQAPDARLWRISGLPPSDGRVLHSVWRGTPPGRRFRSSASWECQSLGVAVELLLVVEAVAQTSARSRDQARDTSVGGIEIGALACSVRPYSPAPPSASKAVRVRGSCRPLPLVPARPIGEVGAQLVQASRAERDL
jgi:hypothetical protein